MWMNSRTIKQCRTSENIPKKEQQSVFTKERNHKVCLRRKGRYVLQYSVRVMLRVCGISHDRELHSKQFDSEKIARNDYKI